MASRRLLGVAIGVLLAGAIAAAIVKGADTEQVAQQPPTPGTTEPMQTETGEPAVTEEPTPAETMTFNGPPPFATTPPVGDGPAATTSPTGVLPRTGDGSLVAPAIVALIVGLGGSAAIARAASGEGARRGRQPGRLWSRW